MRVAVISDVHANRVALDAVLDDVPDVDATVCAGDVVGYNPWPAECVAELRRRDVPTVMGNHDRAVAGDSTFRFNGMAAAGVEHAREELDDDALTWLSGLPDDRVEFDGRMKLVHDHPRIRDKYTYPEEFAADFLEGEDVLVLGHTHVQGHRVFDDGVVMNPGSVGQPRDGDHRAAYAIVDLDDLSVEERRVDYDIESVVEAVKEAGLPERIGLRLYDGQ